MPATSFREYADTKPRKPIWFALRVNRPLFAFAGVWTFRKNARGPKSAPVEGEHELFAFLTTRPLAPVYAITIDHSCSISTMGHSYERHPQ